MLRCLVMRFPMGAARPLSFRLLSCWVGAVFFALLATMYAAGSERKAQTPQGGSTGTQDEPDWVTAMLAEEEEGRGGGGEGSEGEGGVGWWAWSLETSRQAVENALCTRLHEMPRIASRPPVHRQADRQAARSSVLSGAVPEPDFLHGEPWECSGRAHC